MINIAFMGLGAMGEPMAANLLQKGFSVAILDNRNPGPIERLKEFGAITASTPAEAAKGCDAAFLVLPSSAVVEEIVVGKDGLIDGLSAGTVIVDFTTSDPASTRKLGEILSARNIGMVDAGLTRGVAGAKNAKLAYFVGGEAKDIEKVKPALEAMGDTLHMMGALGTGHETKIISNSLSYGAVALVNEALMLGRAFELDLKALHCALMDGAPSKALEVFGMLIINEDFDTPRVTVDNVRLHMDIAQHHAGNLATPMFVHASAQEIYQLASARGRGNKDMTVISEIWRQSKVQN